MSTKVVAVDVGAESGRVMSVEYRNGKLTASELHRFENRPVALRDRLHWNLLGLWNSIEDGLERAAESGHASVGIDTWAVDFGLLDSSGELLGNPLHYRDRRTEGMMKRLFELLDRRRVFEETGIQFMPINTLYQLMAMVEESDPRLELASIFLTVPDLLHYWLSGEQVCEFTNATTTQLYNAREERWSLPVLKALGLRPEIFPQVLPPGTRLGRHRGMQVILPGSHDTASAVAGVPAQSNDFAYISSGTWSLVGTEVKEPVISEEALVANVTNEGGVAGTYRLLKNVMGLWILQQCRRVWRETGTQYSYEELVRLAQSAESLRWLVPVDDGRFLPPGDHPSLIQLLCRESGQSIPESPGEITRTVLESLALAYRRVLDLIAGLSGRELPVVHIVGGGARNALLCQFTANAAGRPVVAGPVEATALGNAAVQLMALDEVGSLAEARRRIAESARLEQYEPRDQQRWEDAYERYQSLFGS